MVRRIVLLLLCAVFSLSASSWRVLVYMDSSDELSDMAIKNISDMVYARAQDHVQLYVQLHAYDQVALRYRIFKEGLRVVAQEALTGNSKQDLIDAASWAFENHTADHTMLVLWNHGWGVLDPTFNAATNEWEVSSAPLSNVCTLKRSGISQADPFKTRRGFMFSEEPRTYLNNDDMMASLGFIKETVLRGKSFDVLAFDTCMGGMLEVGYHIAPYANYLVGNQSCSLRDGFDYQGVLAALNNGPHPREMASNMVKAFDAYYSRNDQSGVYTHTALDLSHTPHVMESADRIMELLLREPMFQPYILSAYRERPRFCLFPMYSDLVAFVKIVEKQLPANSHPAVLELQKAIEQFYKEVALFVVARCGGHTTDGKAYGFSVYMPSDTIDHSYPKTLFAQQSRWLQLLEFVQAAGNE